ncbi:MAG: hypothetical protein EOP11_03495 [Proteobacteria bacterium]|nr:MAG: hypothetical protein EOP11_03495 [Pseudomonadota bacterium]
MLNKSLLFVAALGAVSSTAQANAVSPATVIAHAGLVLVTCEAYVQNLNSFRPEATKPELFLKSKLLVRDKAEAIQKNFADYEIGLTKEGDLTLKKGIAHYRVTSLTCEAAE